MHQFRFFFSSVFLTADISSTDLLYMMCANMIRMIHIVSPATTIKSNGKHTNRLVYICHVRRCCDWLTYFCLPWKNDLFVITIFAYKSMCCAKLKRHTMKNVDYLFFIDQISGLGTWPAIVKNSNMNEKKKRKRKKRISPHNQKHVVRPLQWFHRYVYENFHYARSQDHSLTKYQHLHKCTMQLYQVHSLL